MRPDHDVDYLFGQVSIDTPFVDWSGNCGNLSAAVGPFAIANGLIDADEPSINGVTIQLQQNGEVKYSTQTNEWGYYELSDVYPGTYTLVAQAYPELDITQSVPSLLMISSCLTSGDGNDASSDAFSVESGTRNFDYNLGYVLRSGETLPAAITPGAVQNWTK